jgi:SAM-dependent methyltransferase
MMNDQNIGLELTKIYKKRFDKKQAERQILWQALCKYYFQKYIKETDYVLDLGAGYCEFINNIESSHKYALDINPTVKKMANKDVTVYIADCNNLPVSLNSKFDIVFVSNFFEHLSNKAQLFSAIESIHKLLKPGGKLIVLQPNIKLTKGAYWDFIDHTLALTEKSLTEALELSGFKIDLLKKRFLPYTTESRLPISKLLIRMYIAFIPAQWMFGKQSLFIASKI